MGFQSKMVGQHDGFSMRPFWSQPYFLNLSKAQVKTGFTFKLQAERRKEAKNFTWREVAKGLTKERVVCKDWKPCLGDCFHVVNDHKTLSKAWVTFITRVKLHRKRELVPAGIQLRRGFKENK